jgi:hypothetical protein
MATAFISGHLDLTPEEFEEHYVPQIDEALQNGCLFVIGDARGCDDMAQRYIWRNGFDDYMTIYHMLEKPRHHIGIRARLIGGFKSDKERDAAMTNASDFDIAWVRPGREDSGTARNLQRREKKAK